MASFYGWGSTVSRLEPLRGGSLLFTTKSPEILGTHFIDLKDERLSRNWSHPVVLNMGPLDWESSTLTTRPLLYFWLLTEQLACICSKFSFIVRLYVSVNNYIPVLLPSYDSGYLPNGKLPYFYWSTTKLHLIDLINPNLFIHLTFVVLGFILN